MLTGSLTPAADHLAVIDVLAQILPNLAAYDIAESSRVTFDSIRHVRTPW